MDRKQLEELGLEKDVINKIMDIHSADVKKHESDMASVKGERDAEKKRAEQLQQSVDGLKPLSETNEAIKKELETLKAAQKEAEEKAKAEAADKTLTDGIRAVFGDKKFINEYTENAVIAQIKAEYGKPENAPKGVAKIFEELTKDKDGIFASSNPALPPKMGGLDLNPVTDDKLRAVMGLPAESKK
ncbi:MAG: phage scaffolding protein [Clostridiales bacterium]|jgi:hypothetical protein|nr:phage scaffolding protein [Clostridiales bacterium]